MDRMEIKPNDLISGAMYLKLICDYKKYDKKQKIKLVDLQKQIDFLKWENDDLRLALEESECKSTEKLRTKLKNQRVALEHISNKNSRLKGEIESLTLKIESLTQELDTLKQSITAFLSDTELP